MEKIIIAGAGGFGREVKWLIDRINEIKKTWDVMGFVDDGISKGTLVSGVPVLGGVETLLGVNEPLSVVCAIGSPKVRMNIIERINDNPLLKFPSIVDPSVIMSSSVELGKGCIVCAGTIMTVDIQVGDFTIINLDSTIGHDAKIGSFVTVYPSCNISGNVRIGQLCELGTGTQVIQGISVGESTVVGAGSVVVRELPPFCTAVGVPAKPIKFHEMMRCNEQTMSVSARFC